MIFNKSRPIVACAISGGIDSLVSAYLLKKEGYQLIGVFMKNWDSNEETGYCTDIDDMHAAEKICKVLDMDYQVVNLVKEYWNNVFMPVIDDFNIGATPNPDILCNSQIKFGSFLRYCIHNLQVNAIATGHYAKNSWGADQILKSNINSKDPINEHPRLMHARDIIKDQTFFLSSISEAALSKAIFPVGDLTKDMVRSLVKQTPVLQPFYRKEESMGMCFIGKRQKFDNFLAQYLSNANSTKIGGNTTSLVDIDDGHMVGHLINNGKIPPSRDERFEEANEIETCQFVTIGQRLERRRLVLNKENKNKKYYVVSKRLEDNVIYVSTKWNHPALYSTLFITSKPHWINGEAILQSDLFLTTKNSQSQPSNNLEAPMPYIDCDFRHVNIEGFSPVAYSCVLPRHSFPTCSLCNRPKSCATVLSKMILILAKEVVEI